VHLQLVLSLKKLARVRETWGFLNNLYDSERTTTTSLPLPRLRAQLVPMANTAMSLLYSLTLNLTLIITALP